MRKIGSVADLRHGTKRVEVEWVDSGLEDGWHGEDDIYATVEDPAYAICVSVGYLIYEDDQRVAIAQSFAKLSRSTREIGNVLTIPKAAITAGPRELRR